MRELESLFCFGEPGNAEDLMLLALHLGLFLAVLREPCGMSGMEPRLAVCKTQRVLPAILSLWPKGSALLKTLILRTLVCLSCVFVCVHTCSTPSGAQGLVLVLRSENTQWCSGNNMETGDLIWVH